MPSLNYLWCGPEMNILAKIVSIQESRATSTARSQNLCQFY
jgi:hypothetical protein